MCIIGNQQPIALRLYAVFIRHTAIYSNQWNIAGVFRCQLFEHSTSKLCNHSGHKKMYFWHIIFLFNKSMPVAVFLNKSVNWSSWNIQVTSLLVSNGGRSFLTPGWSSLQNRIGIRRFSNELADGLRRNADGERGLCVSDDDARALVRKFQPNDTFNIRMANR